MSSDDILLTDRDSVAERSEATLRATGERSEPGASEVRAFWLFAGAVPALFESEATSVWPFRQ